MFNSRVYPLFTINGTGGAFTSVANTTGNDGTAGSTFTGGGSSTTFISRNIIVSERPFLNFIQGARIDEVFSGSGVDQARGNDLERLRFNVTQLKTEIAQAGFGADAPGIRLHGDDLERTAFDISLRAYRGVDGTVLLNTIDSSPDLEGQLSSVSVVRGARSVDDVGTLDVFSLFFARGLNVDDFISVGRSIDDGVRRYTPAINPETVVFAITKLIQDTATPDDFLQTFDGLTYRATTILRDNVSIGTWPSLFGLRVSGTDLERIAFDFGLRARQGTNNTVSGVTIAATAQGETVRVGQQSFGGNTLGRRNSGDGQERTFFTIGKGISSITVLAGSPSGARNRPVGVSSGTLTVTAESMTLTDTSTLTLLGAGDSSSYSRWYEAQLPWTVIQDFEQTNDVSSTSVYFSHQGYFTFKFNAAPFLLLSAGFGGWFDQGAPYYVVCPTQLTFVSSWSGIVGTAPNRTFVFQAQSREFDVPPGSGDTSGYAATLIYEVRFYEDDPRKVGIIVGNNSIVNAPNSVAPPGVYIDSPSTTAKRRAIFTTSTNVNGHAVVQNTSFTITHVAWDAPGYNDGTQNTSAETIRLTVGKRATVGTDPVILGFGGTNFGARVSGDDLERTVFNIALRAKQGTNNTVSGVTIAAASSSDVVRVGQQYGLIRFSRDAQERLSLIHI